MCLQDQAIARRSTAVLSSAAIAGAGTVVTLPGNPRRLGFWVYAASEVVTLQLQGIDGAWLAVDTAYDTYVQRRIEMFPDKYGQLIQASIRVSSTTGGGTVVVWCELLADYTLDRLIQAEVG